MAEINFTYTSYDTRYKVVGNKGSGCNFLESSQACFSSIFRSCKIRGKDKEDFEVDLVLTLGISGLSNKKNNCVLLTREEIDYYLKELGKIHPFTYTLVPAENKKSKEDHILHFKTTANYIQMKFLLTSIRYLYEYPYNIIIKDAVLLKHSKKFSNINLFNVFNIIGSSQKNNSWNVGHTISQASYAVAKFCKYNTISTILESGELASVNSIYEELKRDYPENLKYSVPKPIDPEQYFSKLEVYSRYKTYYFPCYRWIQKIPNYIQK